MSGVLVTFISCVVLWGWIYNLPVLKYIVRGWPPMAPLTAFNFLITGIVLSCTSLATAPARSKDKHRTSSRNFARVLSAATASISLLQLADYFLGWHLRLDRFPLGPTSARMSPAVSFDFALLGCSLLLAQHPRMTRILQPLTLIAFLVAWLGFSRYLFGGQPIFFYAHMALHTSILFFLLSVGTMSLRTDYGLTLLLVSDSQGGIISRRLLAPALLVPIILGWFRLQGQRAGWYGTEAGVSLFAISTVIVFGGLVWGTAAMLHRIDNQRRRAEQKILRQLARLDLLRQITHATDEHQDLPSIFQVVIRSLEDNLPVDFGCMCTYDPEEKALFVVNIGIRNSSPELLGQELIRVDQNGFSLCQSGQLVYEPDISEASAPFLRNLSATGLRSLVISPLIVDGKLFGALVVARQKPYAFSSSNCEFLKQLTEHVSLTVRQAQLYDSLRRAYDDLRSSQQILMQQERLRAFGQMSAGIAHDISNSIFPIGLSVESLLQMESNLSQHAMRVLKTIRQSIEDVAQTLVRMRDLYRQREPDLQLVPVQLNDLLHQTIDLTQARWKAMPQQKGTVIHVSADLVNDLPMVMAIESEIREVLINLIFNSVDAMPSGGSIILKTGIVENLRGQSSAQPEEQIYVEVIDSGTGMDEETLGRCMEPFFTTKGEQGTGLGLAMVYGVAKRHGADLEIESSKGKGTKIRLVFSGAAIVTAVPPRVESLLPPSPKRILVVDDDPLLLRTLQEILTLEGHDVVGANGGQNGIDEFFAAQQSKKPFEIVVTDLGMPDIDGNKVAAAVKERSPDVPIILLSGWGNRLESGDDLPPYIDIALSKPCKVGDLRSAIAQCMKLNQAA